MAKGKITRQTVKALTTGETLFDTEVKGFMVRAWAGAKTYALKYRTPAGRQRILSLGEHGPLTPDQARTLAEAARAEVRQGRDPQIKRDADKARAAAASFAQFAELYEKRHISKKKARSADEDRRLLRLHLLPRLGRKPLAAISRADVLALKDDLNDRPVAFNRARALLHSMIERAIEWELFDGVNPVAKVPKNKETPRVRIIPPDEYGRLFAAIDAAKAKEHPSVISAVTLLAYTGARLSEIVKLEWRWVDLGGRALRLPDSKGGAKSIPLGDAALEFLASLPRLSPYVCYGRDLNTHIWPPQRQWRRIRDAAGLSDLRFHDLRHGFATVAVNEGIGLPVLGGILGQKSPEVTARYSHLMTSHVQAAAEKTTQSIAGYAANGAEIVPFRKGAGE